MTKIHETANISPKRDAAMGCLNSESQWIAQQVIYHSFIYLFSFFEDDAWGPLSLDHSVVVLFGKKETKTKTVVDRKR